jgi:predicted metal-dependent hydrolase
VRPRRRTLGIEIAPDGSVLFAVPEGADPQAVAEAVRSRLPRLAHEVTRRRARAGEPVKELIGGTGFSYLGRRHRLRTVDPPGGGVRPEVRLRQGWLELPTPVDDREGARLIAAWYTTRGARWLAARTPPLATRVGVALPQVAVDDLGSRWGSCGPQGVITVHWAVMQLPPALIDLVLVHELVHLEVPGHGAEFRRRVRLALPDADERERRFEAEDPLLWRGAV